MTALRASVPSAGYFTTDDYWAMQAVTGAKVKPLKKPCHDCAVEWGLYTELSDDLAKQPAAIIEAVSARWHCHNHPNRGCAGNIERIAQGTSGFAQDAQRLDPQGAGPVAESDAPGGSQ